MDEKAFNTLLAQTGIAWHDAYKAVQLETDPDKKEKLIYECGVLEKKLQRLIDQASKNRKLANNKLANNNHG